MSEFLCKNCGKSMGYRWPIWFHYDSPDCDKAELDSENSEIMGAPPVTKAPATH